jgi:hypothetical protein
MVGPPVAQLPNSFIVYARSSSGIFGLNELQSLTSSELVPYARAAANLTLILDFSRIRLWDIAALLWLTVALAHFRRNDGLRFRLRLPEPHHGMAQIERTSAARSADFLRRWRFDTALSTIDSDVTSLLVPSQERFFEPPEPREFYKPGTTVDDSNLLQSLISRRLVQIRSLSDPAFTGSTQLSTQRISQTIKEFQAARIGDIFTAQCGIEKRVADRFSDHLLTEALLNTQEHPNATIGLVSISVLGRVNKLILSVVDNGDPISQTIYPRYISDQSGPTSLEPFYNPLSLNSEQLAAIVHHATQPGVTRKTDADSENAGMGLTYIKQDTVGSFSGKLTIISERIRLKYVGNADAAPEVTEWPHPWKGNLLRIALPMTRSAESSPTSTPQVSAAAIPQNQ